MLAAALAACSTGSTLTREERVALYREHAGEPVASFQLPRAGMRQWTPLDDRTLTVWATPTSGHLIELRNPCPRMLTSAGLSFTNSMGVVNSGMDSVVTRGAGGSPAAINACRIETIRPLDANTIRDAKRELREYDAIDRSEAPPESDASPS
ncbi:DUF6491 family protein [Lysobacter sp. KIS68-7]|uniref:DUF6491 family protein n=1 Tax=Lysobacter sp. KIS68-7 TaxID=2904252 RepID=UPI001E343A20|nr:DUF6491 family protein [Lysobacter sp. KIS68-7]UHQ18842.1 DUF6491 family protein [Lysobacter sp. KIS68-7]